MKVRFVEESKVIPPEEGWKENTCYLVDVSYSQDNPVHRAIFIVGFIDKPNIPGGYSKIWSNTYEVPIPYGGVHYLEVIKELCTLR